MNSEDSADVNFAKQAAETTSKAELQLIKPDLSSQKVSNFSLYNMT